MRMENKTNQDKKGPLPWDNFMGNDVGFSYQRENKTDKEKNQVTTSAGKEDDADSTVTKPTAAFTSVGEPERDNYITEGLAETTTAPFFLPWNQVDLIFGKSGQPFFGPLYFELGADF